MDDTLLTALSLNPSEMVVYKAMLASGSLAPAALAKASGMKRTTAYSVAGSLVEKGLLVEDSTKRPRIFTLAGPEQVLMLMDKEKRLVQDREETLKKLANELTNISASTFYPVPTIRLIEESKINDFLRAQTVVWDKSIQESAETTWWGFQDHTFVEQHADWIEWYWKRFPDGVDLKLLSNRAQTEVAFGERLKAEKRRIIKFWGEADNFRSTTWVIGDYLVMINTRAKPYYLVEIHDKLMAHDQREVYKNLWPLV